MTDLLYDNAMAVYDELGQSKGGPATGGSTTTVVDSGLLGSDDDWNGGMVMVVKDGTGAAAAPKPTLARFHRLVN